MRRILLLALASILMTGAAAVRAEETRKAILYKNPQCGCCEGYAGYLRGNGFEVAVKPTHDHATINVVGQGAQLVAPQAAVTSLGNASGVETFIVEWSRHRLQ